MKEDETMGNVYIVTGANGHLGKTIISLLLKENNIEIRGLVLNAENCIDSPNIYYYIGDVTDKESLRPVFQNINQQDVYVIHTAGLIDIQENVSPQIYNVNVKGTQNIISLCLEYHIKKLLYISSVHAIPEKSNSIIKEITSFSQDNVYGGYAKTKAEATRNVLEAHHKGLNTVIVHPSGIIGPYGNRSNHLIQMIEDYIKGLIPVCIHGGYDFVDVRDVALGCIQALRKGKSGECYILSNQYYQIKEIFSLINQYTKRTMPPTIPTFILKIILPFLTFIAKKRNKRPLYTKYSLKTLQSSSHFSHEKATQELGYQPRDLSETIKDTIEWYNKST